MEFELENLDLDKKNFNLDWPLSAIVVINRFALSNLIDVVINPILGEPFFISSASVQRNETTL